MEEGDQDIPKEDSSESVEEVLVHEEIIHDENQDQHIDKTLYDAKEFLTNFAALREENEELQEANRQLELQLEKVRQELQEMSVEKDTLESQIFQEREQNKDVLWNLRADLQKAQEERLQWKEKYLDCCMQSSSKPSRLSHNLSAKRSLKRKLSQSGYDTDNMYNNLFNTLGLADQEQQPEEVILTLISEDSKSYKISIRECRFCGIGFCSALALNEHSRSCTKRGFKADQELNNVYKSNQDFDNVVHCDLCNVKFPTPADLIQHNQYHEGTHKFLCRICNRSYQSNPGRMKHEQFEHGSLPLLHCDACGKQFKRKDRLKDHIATKHSVATPHRCPYCESAFKLRDYLRKHVNQSHPGKTLPLPNINLKTEFKEFKPDYTIKSDGEVTVSPQNSVMPVNINLSNVVESKFHDSTDDNHGKTLTLTSFSIKSDREETVSTEYNHIGDDTVNSTDVQVGDNELSESDMTDTDKVQIIIDTGE